MSSHRSTTPRSAASVSAETLRLWGGKLSVVRGQVTDLIPIRISATGDFEKYENQHSTAETVFRDLPDAHRVEALPKEVRMSGAKYDALRVAHGVVPIYYSDLPNAGRKRDLLGYAFHGGTTLWFFIMNSATEGNLPPWPGDPTKEERNAFTELVVTTAVALYEAGNRPLNLRFTLWNRMERDERYGARLRAVVKDRPYMTLWEGEKEVDLHSPASQVVNSVNSGLSNAEATNLKEALYNGNLNHLRDNRWEKPECFLPLGYRFRREAVSESYVKIHTGEIVCDTTYRDALKELVEMAASGATWTAIGRRAAALRLPQRRLAGQGKTVDMLPEKALARTAKTMIGNPDYIGLWRTGSRTVRRVAPIKGVHEIRGHVISYEGDELKGHVDVTVNWPLPEDGWGVADEVWDRLVERLERESERVKQNKTPGGVAASDQARRAFSGSPTWEAEGFQYHLVPDNPTSYHLRRRDAAAGCTEDGRPRGWVYAEGVSVATFHGLALHASVSLALEAALARLEAADVSIGAIPVTSATSELRQREKEQRLADLEAEAGVLEQKAKAFDELAVTAQMMGQTAQVANYIENAASHRAQALTMRGERERLGAEGDAETTANSEPVVLDLSNPAVVAVALRRFPQHVPAALVDALSALGINESLRFSMSEDGSMGYWRAVCRIPVVGEDATACVEISGVVPNSAPPLGAKPGDRRDFSATVARQFFVEQMSIEAIAATYHRGEVWVTRRLQTWLRSHGVTANGLVKAAMDCPITETRRAIYAACSGDATVVAGLAPTFVEHIAATYLGDHGMISWCPGSMRLERQLLATLTATTHGAAIKHDLAASVGVSPRQVAIAVLGWSRRASIVERTGELQMHLKRCLHPDCPGHPGYLAQYLISPETPLGLICTACRRTPESADVVLPPDYLLAWEGPNLRLGQPPVPSPVDSRPLLTKNQAAERLGCSPHVVSASLLPVRHVGRQALYDPADVEAKRRQMRAIASRIAPNTFTLDVAATLVGVSVERVRKLIRIHGIRSFRAAEDARWQLLDAAGLEELRRRVTPADRMDAGLLGITAAAARVGLTNQLLRAAADRGEVRVQRTASGRYRFTVEDLDDYARHLAAARP